MNILICITGMTGSGKSSVSDLFREKGYGYIRFGQIVLDEVKKRGLNPTEENERPIREEIRRKHGMEGIAVLNFSRIKKLLNKGNVVADGLYSWSEYKFLKDKFKDQMIVLAVFAPPGLRYERLKKRLLSDKDKNLRNRPADNGSAQRRDFAEIENLEKGGPIVMADYTVVNTGSVDELKEKIENIEIDLNERVK